MTTKQAVNARDLHAFLEVGKDFSNWMKDRINQYEFTENQDFVCSPVLASEGRGGHNRIDYHLSLDMAKELSMVERNEKGKQARQYFIEWIPPPTTKVGLEKLWLRSEVEKWMEDLKAPKAPVQRKPMRLKDLRR